MTKKSTKKSSPKPKKKPAAKKPPKANTKPAAPDNSNDGEGGEPEPEEGGEAKTASSPPRKRSGKSNLTLSGEFRGGSLADQDAARDEKEKADPASVKEKGTTLLVEQPKKPKVVGDRFEAFYLKPSFGKNPKGDLTLGFRMTLEMTKEHEKVLPKAIWDAYKDVTKKNRAGVKLRDVRAQHVIFFLNEITNKESLELKVAQILQARIEVIVKKGEGESRKVIRLSFVFQVKHSRDAAHFADFNYGNHFWLAIEEVAPDLLDVGQEDEEGDGG